MIWKSGGRTQTPKKREERKMKKMIADDKQNILSVHALHT